MDKKKLLIGGAAIALVAVIVIVSILLLTRDNTVKYTLTLTASEGGTVSGSGSFEEGKNVTVTATADATHDFKEWQYADNTVASTTTEYTFKMPANDLSLKAIFTEKGSGAVKYTLTLNASEGGTVSSTGGSFEEGTSVTAQATPDSGYIFIGWYENQTLKSINAEYTFSMPAANLTLRAEFELDDSEVADGYQRGTGTLGNPFIIRTKGQLLYLSQSVSTGNNYGRDLYFELEADINLGGIEWAPIGDGSAWLGGKSFNGHFDGKGHKVYNFKITDNSNGLAVIGFFGSIYTATITNFSIENFYIEVNYQFALGVGGLVGSAYNSSITNCSASNGSVSGVSSNDCYVGGLVGFVQNGGIIDKKTSIVSNCFASVDVTGSTNGSYVTLCTGGLVGYNTKNDGGVSTIIGSYATGDVTTGSGSGIAGGLVGINNSVVEKSYATGKVISSGFVGGLAGESWYGAVISESYATGEVRGDGYSTRCGGLVGHSSGDIYNCYATGDVYAISTNETPSYDYHARAGGLVGSTMNTYMTIANCYATGDVYAYSEHSHAKAGGLVGDNENEITGCFAIGSVTAISDNADARAGGIIGDGWGEITDCYFVEGQEIYVKSGEEESHEATNEIGASRTEEELSSVDFYALILGFDEEIWDLTEIDYASGKFPKLK